MNAKTQLVIPNRRLIGEQLSTIVSLAYQAPVAWKLTNHATILNVELCFVIQMLDFLESVGLIGEEPFNTLNGWIVSDSEVSIPMVIYVSCSARTPLNGTNLFCIQIPN